MRMTRGKYHLSFRKYAKVMNITSKVSVSLSRMVCRRKKYIRWTNKDNRQALHSYLGLVRALVLRTILVRQRIIRLSLALLVWVAKGTFLMAIHKYLGLVIRRGRTPSITTLMLLIPIPSTKVSFRVNV